MLKIKEQFVRLNNIKIIINLFLINQIINLWYSIFINKILYEIVVSLLKLGLIITIVLIYNHKTNSQKKISIFIVILAIYSLTVYIL